MAIQHTSVVKGRIDAKAEMFWSFTQTQSKLFDLHVIIGKD